MRAGPQRDRIATAARNTAVFENGRDSGHRGGVAAALTAAITPVSLRLALGVAVTGPAMLFERHSGRQAAFLQKRGKVPTASIFMSLMSRSAAVFSVAVTLRERSIEGGSGDAAFGDSNPL